MDSIQFEPRECQAVLLSTAKKGNIKRNVIQMGKAIGIALNTSVKW
jgi:hypothetical protein